MVQGADFSRIGQGFITGKWNDAASDSWNQVTTHCAWRHTAGRISCLARIPIYALGMVPRIVKVGIKALFIPIGFFVAPRETATNFFEFAATAFTNDAIAIQLLASRITNSMRRVILAPEKDYCSFKEAADLSNLVFFPSNRLDIKRECTTVKFSDLSKKGFWELASLSDADARKYLLKYT